MPNTPNKKRSRDEARRRRLQQSLAHEAAALKAQESAKKSGADAQETLSGDTPDKSASRKKPGNASVLPSSTPTVSMTPISAEMLSETEIVDPAKMTMPGTMESQIPLVSPGMRDGLEDVAPSRPVTPPQPEISPAMREFMELEESRNREREDKRRRLRQKVLKARTLRQQASERFQQEYGISVQYAANMKAVLAQKAEEMMKTEIQRQMVEEFKRKQRREAGLPEKTKEEMLAELPLWMRAVVVIDGWDALETMKRNYPMYAIFCDIFDDEGDMTRVIDAAAVDAGIYTPEDIVGDDQTQFQVNKSRFAIVAAAGNVLENYTAGDDAPDREQLTELIRQVTELARDIYSSAGETGHPIFPE